MTESMGKDESLTPLFSKSDAYKQIMDMRNMSINDKTRTRANCELRTRTILCFTVNLRKSRTGDAATNFLHFDQVYDLELLQWYLKFVENCFYVDRHCTSEIKAVGLKPLVRGHRVPGSTTQPLPTLTHHGPSSASSSSSSSSSGRALTATEQMARDLFGDEDDDEDEDANDVFASLEADILGATAVNMADDFQEDTRSAFFNDFSNKDPRAGIRIDESTSQFHYEVVYVDDAVGKRDGIGNGKGKGKANKKKKKKKQQNEEGCYDCSEATIIDLVRKWMDGIPEADEEARTMCMESFERFLERSERGPLQVRGADAMKHIGPNQRRVDSITLFANIASRHNPNSIFEMMISENRVAQGASGEHCLLRQVRGLVEEQIMGLASDSEDDEDDEEDSYSKKKRRRDKKNNPNAPPTQKAPEGDKLGVHSSHITQGRWYKLISGYTGNSYVYDQYVANSRALENMMQTMASPEVVFSVTHAIRARSIDCDPRQSFITYYNSKRAGYRGPPIYDSDSSYDTDGLRRFVFPVGAIRIPPDEVNNARILPLTFPHIQERRVHPLISDASDLFEEELQKISAVGICEDYDPKFRKQSHDSDGDGDDEDDDDEDDEDAHYAEYCESIMEDAVEFYKSHGITVNPDDISPIKNPFDRDILKSDLPFDMRMARATQVLTTCASSTLDVSISIARTCGELIRSKLLGPNRIKSSKRRRAIRIIHARWVGRFLESTRGSQFPNSSATRAIYEAINNGLYDKVPPSFRRVSDDISIIGNFMAATTIICSEKLFAAEPHLLMTLEVLSLNAADRESYCHTHCLVVGSGAKSKSWNMDRVEAMHIATSENNSTVFQHTDSSKMAHRVGGFEMDGSLFIKHEVHREMLISSDEGGSGDQWWKDVTEKCKSVYQVFEFDKLSGARISRKVVDTLRIVYMGACNFSLEGVEASVLQRFFVMYASNKRRETNMVNTKMVEQSFASMIRDEDQNEENLNTTMQQIQAVIFEVEVLIAAGALERINENIGYLIISFVSNYLENKGVSSFNSRLLRFYVKVARTLCLIDWVVSEYMYSGGRFYGKKISYDHFLSCDPALVITSSHMVLAIGLLAPYSFVQGETEVRKTLLADVMSRVDGYRASHKRQLRVDQISKTTVPMKRDIEQLITKICPRDAYQSSDSSSHHHHQQQPKEATSFKGVLKDGAGAGVGGAGVGGAGGMYGDDDEYASEGDLSEYDLNYCVFHVVTRDAFTQEVHQRMMGMKDLDSTPPENAIRKVIFDQLHNMNHTDFPMQVGTTMEEPLVPKPNAPAEEYPVAKWQSRDTLAIHYGWLRSTADDMGHMEDALKSLFNTLHEPPRCYLYRPHRFGSAYHKLRLGRGYKPGSVTVADRDMNPKTNPDAFQVRTLPNMFNRSTIARVMYANLDEDAHDDWEEKLNANERRIAESWLEADMLYLRESFDQLAHTLRKQDIDWCEEPISEEDLHVAAACFKNWCGGDYSSPEDQRRFGSTKENHEMENGREEGALTPKNMDGQKKKKKKCMGDDEPWGDLPAKDKDLVMIDHDANLVRMMEAMENAGADDEASNFWEKNFDQQQPAVGSSGTADTQTRPVSLSSSYGSLLEFSQSGFEADEDSISKEASLPEAEGEEVAVPIDNGRVFSLKAFREEVKSGGGRHILSMDDLRPDIDLDPSEYSAPNVWYNPSEPEHPLINPRRVPGWVNLHMKRAYYKTNFLGSFMEQSYRCGTNELASPIGNYPQAIIQRVKRQHEMRRNASGASVQKGQHTMAPFSRCAGYHQPDTKASLAERAVTIHSSIRKEQKKLGRTASARRTKNDILREERKRSAPTSFSGIYPPKKKQKQSKKKKNTK